MGWDPIVPAVGYTGDPLAQSLGYVNWAFPPMSAFSNATLTSQKIFVQAIWLPANRVCTGIVIGVAVAGVGTAPTGFFLGLSSPTTMRAQTANLASDAGLTSRGLKQFPFSGGTYTTTTAGLHYVNLLENGAFASTPLQLTENSAVPATSSALTGQGLAWGHAATGQTALPANGASIGTLVVDAPPFWVAVY